MDKIVISFYKVV